MARVFVFLIVLAQAVSIGVNPLPIGQEYNPGSPQPGRMIASPPDHGIPFQTATYFFEHLDGNERSEEFFGEWGIGARGPLVPLGINAILHVFGATIGDQPNVWPVASKGNHLASIYGWISNAFVILGVLGILQALLASYRVKLVALIWVGLAACDCH